MKVSVNSTVSYTVSDVALDTVRINKMGNGVVIQADVVWLDAAGKTLNRKTIGVTAAQVATMNADAGAVLDKLTSFIPSTNGATMVMQLNVAPPVIYVWGPHTVAGKDVFSKTVITEADLISTGTSTAVVVGMINSLVVAMTH